MVWVNISNTDIDADSPLTVALMTALRDNVAAAFAKDAGAPVLANNYITSAMIGEGNIGQFELGANCVGQSELKTTYQSIATTSSGDSYVVASGGAYVIGHTGQGTDYALRDRDDGIDTDYVASWRVGNDVGLRNIRLYYVNSSPPYNLGDGEIPLFIYAIVNNTTREIENVSASPDPSWAYNGKTNIVPTRYGRNGKVYRSRRDMSDIPFTYEEAKLRGGLALIEYISAFNKAKIIEEEITQDMKNADMNDIPHPFRGNDLTGKTVVMIDPVSKITEQLLDIHNHDCDDSACSLITEGYLTIGNTSLNRKGPDDLIISSIKWKKTK